ncbi:MULTISPECIES: acyltransferase [unclassified Bifidobacterium]|uniref:acyltransferase n=1 Tax=unclassified Bifidobacterium TaxID=2608897 RepID=UPI0023F6E615|nr:MULTISPECIES: acyltransferase [unclassified Bifidobacterium]WEV65984.1 acyltransferase [Bifidobacterium sp. ESL0764]WEV75227.1 acyltransferase [Bifidobacterium sp. ESL0800]
MLNILSCFAVVILHTTLPVFTPQPNRTWTEMVVLQAFAIFAVPIFFMISGMNLLGYRERYSTKTFFRKRLWRVGRALLLGSVFCYILFAVFPYAFYGADKYAGTAGIVDFVKRFLTNDINDVYWFFYSIIYLYVLTPLLSYVMQHKRATQYLLALLLAVGICIPFAERLGMSAKYFDTLFGWPLFASVSLLYFVGGYYFHRYWEPIKHQVPVALAILVLSVCAMAFLGLWANGYHKPSGLSAHYDNYYVGMSSPFCVLQAFSLFLLAQSLEPWLQHFGAGVMKVLKLLSSASLGVYLFHILLIDWVGASMEPNSAAFLGRHPLFYAVCVYAITVIAVMVGKQLIAVCKKPLYHALRLDRK